MVPIAFLFVKESASTAQRTIVLEGRRHHSCSWGGGFQFLVQAGQDSAIALISTAEFLFMHLCRRQWEHKEKKVVRRRQARDTSMAWGWERGRGTCLHASSGCMFPGTQGSE